jgi:hypothetical protein
MDSLFQKLFHRDHAETSFQHESPLITQRPYDRPESPPYVKVFSADRFRVNVFGGNHHLGDCLPGEFWLQMEFCGEDGWRPVLNLHEVHLFKIRSVLNEVRQYIDAMSPEKD